MIKKFTIFVKNLIEKLANKLNGCGYLAHCQECNELTRVFLFKETQRFTCRPCMIRYAKLYLKMNKIENGQVA